MSDYMYYIRNIKSLYLKIGKERIYFDDIYTGNGKKIVCIEISSLVCLGKLVFKFLVNFQLHIIRLHIIIFNIFL